MTKEQKTLEKDIGVEQDKRVFARIAAMKKPAQPPLPEQEPVVAGVSHIDDLDLWHFYPLQETVNFPAGTKFYTAPQQRPWVGLTDEEENALIPDPDGSAEANVRRVEVLPGAWGKEYEKVDAWSKPIVLKILRDHEAKLKDKNT